MNNNFVIMDYEKKYREALERARCLYSQHSIEWCDKDIVTIFPELCESKDEKVRKALIRVLNENVGNGIEKYGAKLEEVLAWLEKQDESDETKAKMFLINKGYPIDANGTFPTYEEMYNIIREGLENQDEQKPTDEDMKEALRTEYEKGRADTIAQMQKEWSEEDEYIIEEIEAIIDAYVLEEYNPKALKNWLKSLKDRVLPQPKQEWSEDDDWMKTKIIKVLLGCETFLTPEETNECVYFLKSLKDRYAWKPSDEQIEILELIINSHSLDAYHLGIVQHLYNVLKKLKG